VCIYRSSGRRDHWPSSSFELWCSRAQSPRSPRSSLRQEIHLPCHLRAICWKRRDGTQDHGEEDGRWKTLDRQWNEKVDHQWAVRGIVAMAMCDSSKYNMTVSQTTSLLDARPRMASQLFSLNAVKVSRRRKSRRAILRLLGRRTSRSTMPRYQLRTPLDLRVEGSSSYSGTFLGCSTVSSVT
jgi:hypothetical protein